MLAKKLLLNLLLLMVFAVLVITIINTEQVDNSLPLLTDRVPSDSRIIEIRHNDYHTVIEKQGSGWQITRPVNIPANTIRVESLLRILSAPVHSSYTKSRIDFDKAGVTTASSTLKIDDMLFRFGEVNAATGLRYISDGTHISTIEDVYYPMVGSHFSTLVAFKLLPDDFSIDRLVLPEQTISKDGEGRWQSNTGVSADQIASIINSWASAQAFGVRRYIEPDAGTGAQGKVSVMDTEGHQINFIIKSTEPWLIIARPEFDLEYHLEQGMLHSLTPAK